MRRPRSGDHRTGFGVFLLGTGMGLITNLVTGDPEHWPRVLRPVSENAPLIGGLLLAGVGAKAAFDLWRRGVRRPEWTGDNPYPGLLAYTERWAGVFFGRQTEIQELVSRVRQAHAPPARFVPVVGPSGSGKSSLVLAGLLPALRGGPDVRIVEPFTPGANALGELAAVLGADLKDEAGTVLAAARAGDPPPRPDTALAALATLRSGSRGLLLVVDQLEEAVTLCVEEDRHSFLALIEAMLVWDPRLRVVTTVRSDTVGAFQHGPGRDLFRRPLMVNVLGAREIREVVREPARLTATEFDEGLVDEIVRDAGGGDALPLLSYLLSDLYRGAARDRHITWREYRAGGGVSGAITRQAQAAVGELGGDTLDFCLDTLLRFVTVGPGGATTRQPVRSSSLSDRQRRVVQAFVDARLLVSDTVDDEVVYHIAHEALLRQWQPLGDHVVAHEENLRRLSELVPMARAWLRAARNPEYLIGGARLVDAMTWAGDGHGLPGELREFLDESQRNQAGELDRRADLVAREAFSVLPAEPEVALALALAACTELAPTRLAVCALEMTLAEGLVRARRYSCGVASLAFDRSGRLAVGCEDGSVERGEVPITAGLGDSVTAVAYGPHGDLAAASMDGTVITCDLDGRTTGKLQLEGWGIVRLAGAPDGRWFVGRADGSVRVADRDLREAPVIHAAGSPVYAIAAAADGSLVAGCGDGTVVVWDPAGREIGRRRGHDDAVFAVAAGPGGHIAAGGRDGSVVVWDAAGKTDLRAEHPGTAVTALAFAPDGRLACGFADGLVRVVRTAQPHILAGHDGPVSAAVFAADGLLATGSRDRTVRVWDLDGRSLGIVCTDGDGPGLTTERGPVLATAPDGRTMTRSGTTVVVLEPDNTRHVLPSTEAADITVAAFAPDGRFATGARDGSVRLWDENCSFLYAIPPSPGPVTSLAFTEQGCLTVGHPGMIRTWPHGTELDRLLTVAARQPRHSLTSAERRSAQLSWAEDGGTAS
ncbi:AAA family ATPase [Paractinoplanes atraurantiacus]|uniref:WD40 repeat n=1 Tax=Paractinoplanes atraurantiacus TaxID=1036182 RepID=A0A285K8V5_9ACTN|nr:AAA family ATPase [Actinoplanes atraurantiacus]SNY68673.1 WD40 repeat [Actinoplanes atraurantiacus]